MQELLEGLLLPRAISSHHQLLKEVHRLAEVHFQKLVLPHLHHEQTALHHSLPSLLQAGVPKLLHQLFVTLREVREHGQEVALKHLDLQHLLGLPMAIDLEVVALKQFFDADVDFLHEISEIAFEQLLQHVSSQEVEHFPDLVSRLQNLERKRGN